MPTNMRAGSRRASKYASKLIGDIAKDRADRYGKEQNKGFSSSVNRQVRIEQEVKRIVGAQDVLMNLPYYIIFAKELVAVKGKHAGDTALSEAELYQGKWAGRGLDTNILNTIRAYYFPGWVPPVVVPFRFDVSLLDGPDQLI